MTQARETAMDLIRRLKAGERGSLAMQIAMLLEKSSPLRNTDAHYRAILPPDLAALTLGPGQVEEIVAALCAEISVDPDAAFIAAVSTVGSEDVTKRITELLIEPPRPLTDAELGQAIGIAYAFLPSCLERDRAFLPREKRELLIARLHEAMNAEGPTVKYHSSELLKQLAA
jgi:hypothetical protein